jgi:hypothetical protein
VTSDDRASTDKLIDVDVTVNGRVTLASGTAAAGIRVLIRRLGLGKDLEAWRGETKPDGSYQAGFDLRSEDTPGGAAVLMVVALDGKGREVARRGPLSTDEDLTSVDMVVPDTEPLVPEFDRILADVTRSAARSGMGLDDIQDTEERPDVLVVARALDIPARSVRALLAGIKASRVLGAVPSVGPGARTPKAAKSAKSAKVTKDDPGRRPPASPPDAFAGLFYSLWRSSDDASLDQLLDQPNADLEPRLRRAVVKGVVSAVTGGQIPAFLTVLDTERVRRIAAATPATEDRRPLMAALASVVRDDTIRHTIAEVAVTHGIGSDAFWAALPRNEAVPKKTSAQLRTAVEFLNVSGGHVRLLDRLADEEALTPSSLASITPAEWTLLLRSKTRTGEVVGIPGPPSGGVPEADILTGVVAVLDSTVEALYPTERFVARLERDARPGHPLVNARADIQAFVANNPDFHLRDTPLEALLAAGGKGRETRLDGLADPDKSLDLLKRVQRVYRLLPDPPVLQLSTPDTQQPIGMGPMDRYDAAVRLVTDGADSAPSIAASPRGAFVERYAASVGGREAAELVYRRARTVTDLSLMKALEIHEMAFPAVASAQPTIASWRSLFGAVDMCECEHCSSMISPAAYLVDCLKLLQDGVPLNGRTPLDVLVERRPDLVRLALICDNNIRLPYVDLVNEILERAVARRWFVPFELAGLAAADLATGVATDTLKAAFLTGGSWALGADAWVGAVVRTPAGDARAWHVLDAGRLFEVQQARATVAVVSLTFQTIGTEEELRAAPAHVVSLAHEILAGEVFPGRLPFALGHAEVQAYLGIIKTSIGDVITAFQHGGPLEAARRDDVAASHLRLSPDEFAIIVGLKVAGNGPVVIGGPTDRPADFWGGKVGLIENVPMPPGLPPLLGTWDAVLSYVPLFLERSELTYVELLELLDCYFINPADKPGGRISIVSLDPADPASCSLEKLSLKGLDVATLKRIHRYVRLKRALKWEFIDLDRAISALGAADLDSDTVVALTLIDRLRLETGWPVRELSALWGELDHARYLDRRDSQQTVLPSLYAELFRKNPQVSTPDPALVADPDALTGKLADHHAALTAALTIAETDLDSLLADVRVVPADADLTLSNLSALYRYAAAASILGLTPTDLLTVLDVAGTDPLDTGGGSTPLGRAHAVWSFLAETKRLLSSSVEAATLRYLLVYDGLTDNALDLTVTEIAQLLDGLRTTLGKLVADTTYAPDVTGRTIAQVLVKLGWAQQDATAAQAFFSGTDTYAILLGEAFKPVGLPVGARLEYHEITGELRSVGTLTAAELVDFTTGLPNATQEYMDAVAELAARPRAYARTALQRIAIPTFSVQLTALPAELVIPVALQRNLTFDGVAQRLRFRGDRALLDQLVEPAGATGPRWTAFRAALAALRADPTPATVEEEPRAADNQFFASNQIRDDFSDQVSDPGTRCALALEAIGRAVWSATAPGAAAQVLASALGIEAPSIEAAGPAWRPLVFSGTGRGPSEFVLSASPITPERYPEQFATVRRLHKLGMLLETLEIQADLAPWVVRRAGGLFGFDPLMLPAAAGDSPLALDGYRSLASLVSLQKTTKADVPLVTGLFDLVGGTFSRDEWVAALAGLYAVDATIVDGLTANLALPIATARSPRFYVDLHARLKLRRQTGVAATTLNAWAASFSTHVGNRWTGEFTESRARDVKLAIQALIKREQWLKASTAIQDTLRDRKRDALVSYLLAHPLPSGTILRTDADLFAHFLIDAEMESCMTTSRLKQAISSVQTFVQRVILNLEPTATLGEEVATRWREWQGRYRVWEGYRQIIVTPEIWMEPSLRDDKSESYRAFESRLLQVEMTDVTARQAMAQFIQARADIAHLEVCALYEQDLYAPVSKTATRVLHAFARTRATPNRYYHRMRVISQADSLGTWSAWQKLECDIEGDHLLTISFGRKLYLLWPLIRRHALSSSGGSTVDGTRFEIGLAWSTFDGKAWSAKSLTPRNTFIPYEEVKDSQHPDADALDPIQKFTFQVSADSDGIRVWAYALKRETTTTTVTARAIPSPVVTTGFGFDPSKPYPLLTVRLTLDGQPVNGVGATLRSMGPPAVPTGTWMVVGATVLSPPILLPVAGNTASTKVTVTNGEAVFGQWPVWTPEIVLLRPLTLDAFVVDPLVGTRMLAPITLNDWLLGLFPQVRVDVDFPKATVTTSRDVRTVTRIAGIGGLVVHYNNRTEHSHVNLADLEPPVRTLPEGQWWREDSAQSQSDALDLPGQLTPVFQRTPGQYRLLPAPLAGPIKDRMQFAFEAGDKTYLVERRYGNATQAPAFTTFFDAQAENLWNRIAADPDTALSRELQSVSNDGGLGFRALFGGQGQGNAVQEAAFPAEKIEFGAHDVFRCENWETFLHAEVELAGLLTRHNRFADAQRHLHTIYNPLSAAASAAEPWEVWQFLPFYEAARVMAQAPQPSVFEVLAAEASNEETRLTWQQNPFSPYAVARLRISAFMKNVVLRYLDNLIAWGDYLYRQDTIESINEATQLYLLAAEILGDRPEIVPPRARPITQTFQSLAAAGMTTTGASSLGLLLVEISGFIEPNASGSSAGGSLGTMPYFCVPQNERLRDYWKTVQGRLQKIRRCEDITGRRRELDLFEPAIDPALLVRAKAAGIDIGSILNDLYAPPPHYRYSVLAQKAMELINETRALAAASQSALEKEDAEALARLTQSQTLINLDNTRDVREKQISEARAQVKALSKSRDLATIRFRYYQRLLGDTSGTVPGRGDAVKLADYLSATVPIGAGASDQQGLQLAQHESQQIDLLNEANGFMLASNAARTIAAVLHAIPNSTLPFSYGGIHIGSAADATAGVLQLLSTNFSHQASRLGMVGGFVRRQDDWTLQRNAAAQELSQLDAQLDAADIRVEIAEAELRSHETLMEQSEAIRSFLHEKHSTQELYQWMVDQLAGLYYQSYDLAYRVAKQAEVAWRRDLGVRSSDWIKFGHWDGLKRGLLAGERLALDLKRMDVAYLEQNAREYEITKHISLVSLNPNAFLDLKATGSCEFDVPEWLFDLDHPGHYLRRIRSASVTVPCVVGPSASVNCTVTLQSSSIRVDPDSSGNYDRATGNNAEDRRFLNIRGASESIVTSGGQADMGLFEANLRDERYLPFESHGAVSRWKVRLGALNNGLVLDTATDFILHLRYTARDGGAQLEQIAQDAVQARVRGPKTPLYRMLSLRHEYPTEWNRFRSAGGTIGPLDLSNRIPALFARRAVTVSAGRAYFAVTGGEIAPLRTGTQKVEFRPTSGPISVSSPKADSVDLAGSRPNDLIVVFRYAVGGVVPPA